MPVVQLAPQHRAQLRGVWHALPHQAAGLFGHAQHNGAALGVGHGGIRLPKTAGHAAARRFEFGVDAFGAGLEGGEEIELAHGYFFCDFFEASRALTKNCESCFTRSTIQSMKA